jgi:ABC-type branched-subunit amino acid transport system substrate-binding protein
MGKGDYLFRPVLALFLGCLLAVSPTASFAAALTPQEARGKQIYLEGKSSSGEKIHARVGRSRVKVPGSVMPCGNCHGPDGLGRPEGGVEPPDITWTSLTKEYGHRHPDGRTHPPFDDASLANSIREGVDPALNELDITMPIYEISETDMAALIAYMKLLEGDLGPGVSDSVIRIATLAPGPGPFEEFGVAVTGVLEAYLANLNDKGGVYGRSIELVVVERGNNLNVTLEGLRRFLDDDPVFAFVAAFAPGMEREFFLLLEENGLPNLGPVTLLPVPPGLADGNAFLIAAGAADQARALAVHLKGRAGLTGGGVAVVHNGIPDIETVVRAVAREGAALGWPDPIEKSLGQGNEAVGRAVTDLAESGVGAVIYIGSDEGLTAFGGAVAETSWRPTMLVSGPLNARAAFNLPTDFKGKVFAAYPTLPSDRSDDGNEELRLLQEARGLGRDHLATQISALAAAKVLVEGLRRSGRALSREKLVESLESLSKFETGLMPAISYGPAKRVGASGAYVIEVDPEQRTFAAAPVWHDVD